ncbi:hypothetical protein P154DRAFT_219675 [Amniculicola lignicola CBS 123094]|uniref:Uncharacterized protein n=1 Tax=Amniculicola lignicola CBS 123094 TaxID=1392246 RepID=A0A6A5WY90_9PLEO|nr:hypothetical protein P154DRAFT_219675 [Amniculicola lignicola CBS 123094]
MATTMFGDYSLATASRNTSQRSTLAAERAAMNVSPTCMPSFPPPTRLPTPPPCTIGDLAQQFTQHTLHVEVDPAYQHYDEAPPTPPSDDDDFAFPGDVVRPSYCRISTSVLRQQRQANMRMQCSPSHIRDISRLVQMIEQGDQCRLCKPKSRTPSNSSASTSSSMSDNDEGVDMEYTPPFGEPLMHKLSFRRSSDRSAGYASVTRSVRVRKHARVVKRSSR